MGNQKHNLKYIYQIKTMPNLNKRIVDLPLILANDISSLDVLPIVNVEADVTNKVTIGELANYFDSSDTFLTGVTYNTEEDNLTLSLNNGTTLSAEIPRYNRWFIPSGRTYTIENNFQSFVYGDLIVEGTLDLEPEGQLIVLNGDIILSGGTIIGSGTTYSIDIPEFDTKISAVTYNTLTDTLTISSNDGTNFSSLIPRYNRWHIPSGQTYIVESNFQNFIYGDLIIEGTLDLELDGQLVVVNGDIILSGGSIVGSGTTYLIGLPEFNTFVTGGTYDTLTNSIDFSGNFGFSPFSVDLSALKFTGNTSGECISDIYVSNLHSCSPLHINPNDEGDVIFGNPISGVTIDVINSKVTTSDLNISTTPITNNSLQNVLVRDVDGSIKLRDTTTIGGAVNYGNVIFVDSTNGNDGTGAVNDFTKPMLTINAALSLASTLSPSFTNRALIYLRRGYYGVNDQSSPTTFVDYADFYSEPGVVIQGGYGRISDQFSPAPVNVNFMGYADLYNCDFYIVKSSTINIQVNSITNDNAAFLVLPGSGTANVTIEANKIYSQGNGTAYGSTIRNSSNVTVNIKQEYSATYSLFDVRNHSGRIVVNAPKLALATGNPYGYGGNFKQVIIIRANLGGEMIINGDLVNEDTGGYYGGLSAMITRFQDSWGTLRLNGNIYSSDTFGINAQGTSLASRTIVNGDIRTNHLVAYVGNSSQVILRNGTLMNWNTYSAALLYPILSIGGTTSGLYVENCTMYSLGTGGAGGINKDTQASTLVVNNVLYSGADTLGFFVINTVGGQPINNTRFNNVRSSKPLDTNITDLLSPTGFILDTNTLAPNFI